uniref:Uncharacterized protein n=1 Tax=Brassica oleracea var. oleracea TaxID=109376 RepID=A0A0D3E389_BRAOL
MYQFFFRSEDEPRPAARLRRCSVSSSRASESSHEQNSVPAYIPAPAPLPLPLLLNRIWGSCQLNYWFNNQVESISRFSNPTHDEDIALGSPSKSKNGISRSINQMIMYVHNLGACSMSTKEDELMEVNDGNPVDRLQLIKVAHTNKKTDQIQDLVIKGVVDLVEAEIASQSQLLSDDGDSTGASTNLSLLQINEMVEKAVPKRKGGRLVWLARRASPYPASSSHAPYADPMILEELHDKDERIGALEEQNTTILSENATIRSENDTILAELASQKKFNAEIMKKLDRLMSSSS